MYNTLMIPALKAARRLLPFAFAVIVSVSGVGAASAQEETDIPEPEDVLMSNVMDQQEDLMKQLEEANAGLRPFTSRLAEFAVRQRELAAANAAAEQEAAATVQAEAQTAQEEDVPAEESEVASDESSLESLTPAERRLIERSRLRGIAVEASDQGGDDTVHAAASEEELPLIPTGPATSVAMTLLAATAGWTLWRAWGRKIRA